MFFAESAFRNTMVEESYSSKLWVICCDFFRLVGELLFLLAQSEGCLIIDLFRLSATILSYACP
jgi:hypothetical protein